MVEFSTFAWFPSGWVGVVVQMMKGPNARRESTGAMLRCRTWHSFGIVCIFEDIRFKSVQSRRGPKASASDSCSGRLFLANVASAHPVH